MTISIAMCTYNGARYLQKQLQSFANQTLLPDEVVICDDGSSDDTIRLIADFSVTAPFPVRLFRNDVQLGSTKNFEKAIGLCNGELIALADQDDEWYPEKLSRISQLLKENSEAQAVFTDADLIDDSSQPTDRRLWKSLSFQPASTTPYLGSEITSALLRLNYIATGATMVFRAELRRRFNPIPPKWFHDAWIAWIAASRNALLAIPDATMRYRVHTQQQVGVAPPSLIKNAANARSNAVFFRLVSERLTDLCRALEAESNEPTIADLIHKLDSKIAFMSDRAAPDKSVLKRLWWICRSWQEYQIYARGPLSMVSDAFLVSSEPGDVIRKA